MKINHELPSCPNCGKPVSYINAWLAKDKGEFFCSHCKETLKIKFDKNIYKISWIIEFIALIVVVLSIVFGNQSILLSLILTVLPFLFFYAITPFLMNLYKK